MSFDCFESSTDNILIYLCKKSSFLLFVVFFMVKGKRPSRPAAGDEKFCSSAP